MEKKFPFYLGLLLFVYLASFFVVSPFYEYPIGDAWTYARVAKTFFETGQFRTLPWYGQSLIFQILWAFLFLLPSGFSFSALNVSNAVMGIAAILFFDLFMRELRFDERERFWGTLLLIVSPPFIFLSRTFYTDLPFLALYLGAAYAYTRGLLHRTTHPLFIGGLLLSLSVLVRQVAIFLPLVLLVSLLRERKDFSSGRILALLVPFGSLALFTVWQHRYFGGIPPANLLLSAYALRADKVLFDILRVPFYLFLYFGYYLSPLLLPAAFGLCQKRKQYGTAWNLFLSAIFGFALLAWFLGIRKGTWMPDYLPRGFNLKGAHPFYYAIVGILGISGAAYLFSVIYPEKASARPNARKWAFIALGLVLLWLPPVREAILSFGKSLLPPVYHFFSAQIHLYQTLEAWQTRLPSLYDRTLLSLAALVLSAGFLFEVVPLMLKQGKRRSFFDGMPEAERLFHKASFFYLIFLLFLPVTTDRYLFPVFPSAILLSLRAARLFPYRRALSLLLIFCVFIPALFHTDRLIQRVGALWEGGHFLLEQGVPAEHIDAGFVFNGWYLYEKRQQEGFEGTDRGWREQGWWVTDAAYRIATSLNPQYEVLRQIPYRDLLTSSRDVVYVMKRR